MKAVVVTRSGGPEVLAYETVDDPSPGEDEVLIRTEAAGLNFGDLMLRQGRYHAGSPPPVVAGMDVAGTIVGVGSAVVGLSPGQRVAATMNSGGHAELAKAKAVLTWPLPVGVEAEQAAAFPSSAITAYNVLTLAGRLAAGESVLVHSAAGGVGTVVAPLAKLFGAALVIGTIGERAKAEPALAAGYDAVVVRGEEDFVERVGALTDGRGVDLILDPIAGPTLEAGLDCLAPFGRLVAFGIAGEVPGHVASNQLHPTNRAVIGYSTGHYRANRPEALRPAAEAILDLLADGRLELLVGARYAFSEAAQAHELMESRRSVGKIILLPRP